LKHHIHSGKPERFKLDVWRVLELEMCKENWSHMSQKGMTHNIVSIPGTLNCRGYCKPKKVRNPQMNIYVL